MKKSKRLLVLIFVLVAISLLVTGCVNDNKETDKDTDKDINKENVNDTNIDKSDSPLLFELNEDGESYSLIGIEDECPAELIVPEEYQGKPVTSIGDNAFRWQSFEKLIIPNSVTKLGASSFFGCSSLVEVVLSDSLTEIGEGAFRGCKNLPQITIPNSVSSIGGYAFFECDSLVEVDIPDGVNTLGANAFEKCDLLKRVKLGDNIKIINENTFHNCKNLKEIILPKNLEIIGNGAFSGCANLMVCDIPDTLLEIGYRSFAYCYSLNRAVLPKSLEKIGEYAFEECTALYEICNKSNLSIECGSTENGYVAYYAKHITDDISEEFIKIKGDFVFYDDGENVVLLKFTGDVEELILPQYENDKKYDINTYALLHGNNIRSIVLSDTIEEIGFKAFENCEHLETVTFNCHGAKIDVYAFGTNNRTVKTVYINTEPLICLHFGREDPHYYQHYYYCAAFQKLENAIYGDGVKTVYDGEFRGDTDIKNIVLSSTIESIGVEAFWGCKNATIVIPEDIKITEIKDGVFNHCQIASFVVPSGVTYIGKNAFADTPLTSITLSENLKVIDSNAFSYCHRLKQIDIPDSVEVIGEGVFYNCSSLLAVNISENSSLQTIGESAFSQCYALTKLYIPKTLTTIAVNIFKDSGIYNFVIHEDNPAYAVVSGNLYTKDLSVFVCVAPTKKTVVIPASVERIGENAFYASRVTSISFEEGTMLKEIGKRAFYYSYLESISLPSSLVTIEEEAFAYCQIINSIDFGENPMLTTIGDRAFRDCYALDSLIIPTSVKYIGNGAFIWLGSFKIYYNDTAEAWENIEKGTDLYSGSHQASPFYIYCTDETIIID